MNKTAILSFILDEVAVKARNVSTNMRKRIHYMLKHMEITLREYDERALMLNGWIRVGRSGTEVPSPELMKKGISNYCLRSPEQIDRLIALNNEVRCYSFLFGITDPLEIESIDNLNIDQENYKILSKCSFNKVKNLKLNSLSTDLINNILTRFKTIDKLLIHKSSLGAIDLRFLRIRECFFSDISFKEPVFLPRNIGELNVYSCKSPNLIKAQKVTQINLKTSDDDRQENEELIKALKGVRVAGINKSLRKCFTSFPCGLKKISFFGLLEEEEYLEKLMEHFPNLIEVNQKISIEALNQTKLRVIHPEMSQTEEKFKLRPRKIIVDSNNVDQLNNHPELFEKVESVDIDTNKFNFDLLPREIKRIQIRMEMNEESAVLNRFEKECR